jgi:hypothetical protein
MDATEFLTSRTFMGLMCVMLFALVALLVILVIVRVATSRTQPAERGEDEPYPSRRAGSVLDRAKRLCERLTPEERNELIRWLEEYRD